MTMPLTNSAIPKCASHKPGHHSTASAGLSRLSRLSLLSAVAASLIMTAPNANAQENADLENGKYMFTIAGCGSCHGKKGDPTQLTGGYEIKTDFGTFVTPNISMDPEAGIGKWSKADFYTALKEGISPRGSHYYPTFPYASYAGMSKKDIFDIFGYIKTLPAITVKAVDHNLSFPYNLRNSIGLWKIAAAPPLARASFTTAANILLSMLPIAASATPPAPRSSKPWIKPAASRETPCQMANPPPASPPKNLSAKASTPS